MNTDPNSTPAETESTEEKDDVLQAELPLPKDQYLRLAADFDNFRKRTAQETERRAAAQKEAFIGELLPIIDNLERALASGPSASREQVLQGVEMTLQQFNRLLRAHGIEPEESVGQPFDPRYHEAVVSRYDPTQSDHVVLETIQRGYRRGNELFRPAKVVVNDLSSPESTSSPEKQVTSTDD
jgi:molecular chaperone GrpE